MIETITGIKQFDFQILRFTGELRKRYPEVSQDLKVMGEAISDFETWYAWWYSRATFYEDNHLIEVAMTYYRASLFYLSFSDYRKYEAYKSFRRCFEMHYQPYHLNYFAIPYGKGKLPAIFMPKKGADRTLIVIGGFDSFAEELVAWFLPLQNEINVNIILFDGPGQGSVPFQKIYFEANYEKVVTTVLDYFKLETADANGISWGGYFVLRAAAFEKRLERCVCFDIFYSALDTLKLQTTTLEYFFLKQALFFRQKYLINSILKWRANNDFSLKWMLQHGTDITGEKTYFDFIENISQHSLQGYANKVTQDCLLLAGSEDMYVPKERLGELTKELVNAKSVTSKLFDKETGGVLHCQIDNILPAIKEIISFLQQD